VNGDTPLQAPGKATCKGVSYFLQLTYGRHTLEQAVFYSASDQFALDMTVLAIVLGTLSMLRGITTS
jgi:hypothetical protein